MSESYAKQLSKKQILELRSILSDLPPYVKDFMCSIETTTQPRTRIGYAHDIKYFFEFLQSENPFLKKKEMYDRDRLYVRSIHALRRTARADQEMPGDHPALWVRGSGHHEIRQDPAGY